MLAVSCMASRQSWSPITLLAKMNTEVGVTVGALRTQNFPHILFKLIIRTPSFGRWTIGMYLYSFGSFTEASHIY